MPLTIDQFWRPKLVAVRRPTQPLTSAGWEVLTDPDPAFVEAELVAREGFDDLTQRVWLVAAPGAVGKSTLARELCARTGAVYVDLARSRTVGGAHLTGELHINALYADHAQGKTTLIIDALDEARLRVTSQAFEDFIDDIAKVAKSGPLPLVLAGRVGIIEDIWAQLSTRHGFDAPIMDIGLFDERRAEEFITKALHQIAGDLETKGDRALTTALAAHRAPYQAAVHEVVAKLSHLSREDGRRFSGYAPVLQAVARVLSSETNPAKITDAMSQLLNAGVLRNLTNAILEREANKLRASLKRNDPTFPAESLYGPDEQLVRLGTLLWGKGQPAVNMILTSAQLGTYEAAVNEFLSQHPFLDWTGKAPAGAVFGACILAHALHGKQPDLAAAAEKNARGAAKTPNPFLADFYLSEPDEITRVPMEHVGLVFESIQARALPGESVRLLLEAGEEDNLADVEIVIAGAVDSRQVKLVSPTIGTLRFGMRVNGVTVEAPQLDVELGNDGHLEIIAPVAVSVRTLHINAEQVEFRGDEKAAEGDDVVALEAGALVSRNSLTVRPRSGVRLSVNWPDAKAFPWTSYAFMGDPKDDEEISEALRALRRLVISFRSHSKGQLARYRGKIEHARMTKGQVGDALRLRLLRDGVLSEKGEFYILDPSRLGEVVGLNFGDAKLRNFSVKTKDYVRGLL